MALTITQIMDGRPCWERITNERAKAFAAFAHYRDQGPTRTMRATAEMLIKEIDPNYEQQEDEEWAKEGKARPGRKKMSRLKKETSAIGTLQDWAHKYAWQERAEFFDRHMDRLRIEQMERDTKEMAHRHVEFSTKLIDLAKLKLQQIVKPATRPDGTIDPDVDIELSPSEALKFGVEGVKIERLTRGKLSDMTGIVESEVPTEVRSSAREELKRRIDAIAEKKKLERERAAEALAEQKGEEPIRAEPTGKPDLKLEKTA